MPARSPLKTESDINQFLCFGYASKVKNGVQFYHHEVFIQPVSILPIDPAETTGVNFDSYDDEDIYGQTLDWMNSYALDNTDKQAHLHAICDD